MKSKKELWKEIINTLVDVGYTAEVLQDYIIDKQTIQIKKHFGHLKGQLDSLPELIMRYERAK